jgi:hypothetical protein
MDQGRRERASQSWLDAFHHALQTELHRKSAATDTGRDFGLKIDFLVARSYFKTLRKTIMRQAI